MVRNPTDFDRREFLKRTAAAGTTGLVAAGITGTASARVEPLPTNRVEGLLDAHADATLSALEADGIIADREGLPTGTALDLGGIAAGDPGAAKVSMPDEPTELRVVTEVERGTLTLLVRPGDGEAAALLDGEGGRLAYDPGRGWYDFDAASTCSCIDELCADWPAYLEKCCSGSRCTYDCTCY